MQRRVAHDTLRVVSSLPDDYQAMSGADKLERLWERVSAEPYTDDQLPVSPPGMVTRLKLLSVDFNRGSFDPASDEMTAGRRKIIHSFGTCAVVRWEVTEDHQYTGVFATGGRALLRVSDATGGKLFAPSLAFKFFVDGHPSLNVLANQAHYGPARDFDVFNRYYSNSLPAPRKFDTKLVDRSFQKTARALGGTRLYSVYLPLHDPAGQNLDGSRVDSPVVPDRVELHPTGDVHLTSSLKPDWRVELRALPADTVLFDLRTAASIDEPVAPYGRVILERSFVASPYGDQQLFFQHHIGPRA